MDFDGSNLRGGHAVVWADIFRPNQSGKNDVLGFPIDSYHSRSFDPHRAVRQDIFNYNGERGNQRAAARCLSAAVSGAGLIGGERERLEKAVEQAGAAECRNRVVLRGFGVRAGLSGRCSMFTKMFPLTPLDETSGEYPAIDFR